MKAEKSGVRRRGNQEYCTGAGGQQDEGNKGSEADELNESSKTDAALDSSSCEVLMAIRRITQSRETRRYLAPESLV